jgi:hypothetical protein
MAVKPSLIWEHRIKLLVQDMRTVARILSPWSINGPRSGYRDEISFLKLRIYALKDRLNILARFTEYRVINFREEIDVT